ncbi:hypothetical protein EON68_03865, partial [archaeon]
LGGTSRTDSNFLFSYAPPVLSSLRMLPGAARLLTSIGAPLTRVPTLGMALQIVGTNLGSPDVGAPMLVMDNNAVLNITFQNHTLIVVRIPAGDGVDHTLRYFVGNQWSPTFMLDYAPPSVTDVTPRRGPTLGGTLITLRGANFGVTPPVITLGGLPCTVAASVTPSAGHDTLTCTTSAGQGTGHVAQVSVSGQASVMNASIAFSYNAPRVDSVSPSGGPTSGRLPGALLSDGLHRAQGERVMITLRGADFGRNGSVALELAATETSSAQRFVVPPDDVVLHNDTHVHFYLPPGYGEALPIRLSVSGQANADAVTFTYDAPSVSALGYYNRQPTECAPRTQCFEFQNRTVCKVQAAGCWDTRGESMLELVGASFGPQDVLSGVTVVT